MLTNRATIKLRAWVIRISLEYMTFTDQCQHLCSWLQEGGVVTVDFVNTGGLVSWGPMTDRPLGHMSKRGLLWFGSEPDWFWICRTSAQEHRPPLADGNPERRKVLQAEMESRGRAAVTTVGAIYSSPINKAPTDSDTQADRGIIFIWYLAKAPLLKRLLSVNDKQLSFD